MLRDELIAIRDKYGDERKTEIQDIEDDIDIEDLIEEEQCVFTLSHGGNIKRVPVDEYTAQKRGGKGVRAATLRDEDYVDTDMVSAVIHAAAPGREVTSIPSS